MTTEPLIRARGLKMHFRHRADVPGGSRLLRAVDGVDLDIHAGETVGLVGESGCGKSTLCRLLLWLIKPTEGEVTFDGKSLGTLDRAEMKAARSEMQFIFQDLQGSLDPRMRIRRIVGEGPDVHKIGTRAERDQMVVDVLEKVGLTQDAMQRYAHEFSGGQRQRIGIARALIMRPRLVVADEPVSALDVSIQAQILNQLIELKRDFKLTMVFVTHDLAAVGHVSDRVAVMYLGKLVEVAPTDVLLNAPEHPYTRALLSAVPEIESDDTPPATPQILRGELPSALDPPSGCHFRTRCPMAQSICAEVEPEMRTLGDGHRVACHFVGSGPKAA